MLASIADTAMLSSFFGLRTRPAEAPGSIAGPRGGAIPSTRIDFRPRPSFSRPSVDVMSWPHSSFTRSIR